jgi:pimeloyl-ACP methyl ester carboxylesterase
VPPPGVVDARFFDANIDSLAAPLHVYAVDLRGHGHTADVEGPFTYEALAQDTIQFLEAVVGGPAHLVGHSVGAGVALHVALRRPDLVRRLVLVSGAFHHDGQMGGIAGSELAVVPGTSHFLLQEKPRLCNSIVVDFLTADPVPTVAPMRRAQTPSDG